MANGGGQKVHRGLVVGALLALAGLLLVFSCLTLFASLVGLASQRRCSCSVLVPAALLASLVATGAAVSGSLTVGSLSLLSRLARAASTPDYVEQGKRRVGEVAGHKSPHAALAVASRGHGATDHKKPQNYKHHVAGRMVQNA